MGEGFRVRGVVFGKGWVEREGLNPGRGWIGCDSTCCILTPLQNGPALHWTSQTYTSYIVGTDLRNPTGTTAV